MNTINTGSRKANVASAKPGSLTAGQFSKTQKSIVEKVLLCQSKIEGLGDLEIRSAFEDLRASVFDGKHDLSEIAFDAIAFAREAVYRVTGKKLYKVQILAGHATIKRQIAEMQTGEGKTISAVPVAVFGGMLVNGAHVATPNSYLAVRDFEELKPIYEFLGLSVGLLDPDSAEDNDKSQAYACDITYGPGYEFGFDYLRDQLLLKSLQNQRPGKRTLDQLMGSSSVSPSQIRGLGFAVIDEADNVLLDDAMSPQILSEMQMGDAADADAIKLAYQLANQLESNVHFSGIGTAQIELTEIGIGFIHGKSVPIPIKQLRRPWSKYVEAALRATYYFERDVHYVIDDGEIKIVDESTGRIFEDRTWQSGLHQAVEAKEKVRITPESISTAQITRQRFYRLYKNLAGMTGTASSCVAEFKSVYGLDVTTIPLRVASQRLDFGFRAFDNQERKWSAIADSVREMHEKSRPVLIGTRTILESQFLASLLESHGLDFNLLNGKQDADEAAIVSQAGQMGAVTIATNLAGRGTDIKLTKDVADIGGLHVIVSECHASARVDRQLIGRCGRQGDPGSCQTFVSADDWVITTHANWLSSTMKSLATNGELSVNIQPKIRRLQNQLERQQFAIRLQMLRSTEQKDLRFS